MKLAPSCWSIVTKTRFFLAFGIFLLAFGGSADAQQPKKISVIGYLSGLSKATEASRLDGLPHGLHDLGYIEGETVLIEYRFSNGANDRLPALAADLIRRKVDVLVTGGEGATRVAQQATKTIPIVMAYMNDPVGLGFVASLAKPGANITGLTQFATELGGKRLELLKEVIPQVVRVAALGNPQTGTYELQMKELRVTARALNVQLQTADFHGPEDLETAFSGMVKERVGAFIAITGNLVSFNRKSVVELTSKHRLAAMYPLTEFTDVGGLMSYAPNYVDLFRRAATYIDKVLNGVKPANLPVERPKKV